MRDLAAASAAGLPVANYNMGIACAEGRAIAKDPATACVYFRRAAERGHILAAFNLGESYRAGTGVRQDYVEAARWYRVAAERGDYKAANELGLLYVEGKGVKQDLAEGFAWIYMGTHQSIQYEAAFKNARQLATILSREQIEAAQIRGQEYYKRYISKDRRKKI